MQTAQTFHIEHVLRNISEYPSERSILVGSEELVEFYSAETDTNTG
jgi:hypothetical protein